ncbi:MAG: glycosyltransferase family 4 protein [Pseudomonadota bacterium]
MNPPDQEKRSNSPSEPVEVEMSPPVRPIVVLHLRASRDWGGGPEKTIINTGRLIDRQKVTYLVGYLRRRRDDLGPTAARARGAGLEYFEFPGRRFFDFGQIFALVGLIKNRRVDILHSHEPKSDFFALALRLLRPRLKTVTTLHGWVRRPGLKNGFYLWLDRLLLPYFDLVLTVSSEIDREARGRRAGTVLIYNAVDTTYWKKDGPDEVSLTLKKKGRFLVGFVGRLSPEKGAMDFLGAAARIIERDDEVDFVVAGEGPEEQDMKDFVKRMNLGDRILFLGRVAEEAVLTLYRQLDCLLSPSHTEGLPNNLLEALAMETPIVAAEVGGVGELVRHGHNGLLCRSGDIETMVGHVLTLKGAPDLARNFTKRGREMVERSFSFQRRVARLEEIYLNLALDKNGPDR